MTDVLEVRQADPGRAFAFECSMMDFHFSTWGYRMEPTETTLENLAHALEP